MATLTQAQLQTLATGIQAAMENLQSRVETRVLAEDIPLVGSGLAAAAAQVAPPTILNSTEDLGVVLAVALHTLAGAGDQVDTVVQSTLAAALLAQGFTGTTLGITVVGGEVVIMLATERFGSFAQALADDLGMAGLNISAEGSADVDATFTYDLEFGANVGGFFLDVAGGDEVEVALNVGSVTLAPSGEVDGQAYNMGDAGSSFTGTLTVNLDDPDRLTAAAVATTGVIAGLTGGVDLAIGLELADQGEMTPSLSAVLTVDWDFVNATVTPDGTNAGFGTTPELSFVNVTMDLGGFMENFVAPLVRQVNDLLDPIRPIIDVLTASITVLENLPGLSGQFDADNDGNVTLVDILDLLPNTNLNGLRSLIAVVEQVLDWADFLEGQGFGAGNLILGDFAVTGDIRHLGFDLAGATASFGGIADDLNTVLASLGGAGWADGGRDILQGMVDGDIFSLPILTDPQQWMQLFLGNPVDLVAIDLPTVKLQTPEVPLVPPIPIFPGILFEVLASAGLTMNFDFGFSSRGLVVPGLDALDGFFIVDAAGPEVELSVELILQLSLNAFVANITGGGAVEGTIDLELMNGSESGRLYFDELQAAFTTNPFSIFDASGAITLEFFAYVEALGFEVWRWTSPKISLGGFSFDGVNDPVDYNLAERTGGSLRLNVGDRANLRTVENLDVNEQVEVMMDPTGTRTVVLMDFGSYSRRQEFTDVATVRADGGLSNDSFVMAEAMTVEARFFGGVGHDVLAGGAGADSLEGNQDDDALFGGIGDDTLLGGVNDDTLRGGAGADVLDGGGGDDVVTYFGEADGIVIRLDQTVQQSGFAMGDQLISIEHIDGTNGDDRIEGSQGIGSFTGHGGNDTLISGTAVQVLYGNEGNDVLESNGALDTLVGGMGNDTYIVRAVTTVVSENFLGELTAGTGGNDTVQAHSDIDLSNNGAWIERIDMFGASRNVTGDSANNRITGTTSDDSIDGYIGSDSIFGGIGNDTLKGGLGTNADTLDGGDGNDSLDGGLGGDSLTAGAGNDTLIGNSGADTLIGGTGNDLFVAFSDDIISEFAGSSGGTDQVWAQNSMVLATGVAVEILSVRSLAAGDWQGAYAGANRAADLFTIASTQGVNGADMNANLTGNSFAQVLMGVGGGSSTLSGLGGADTLIGDAGFNDTADYTASTQAVQISLGQVSQTGGDAQGDVLLKINRVAGSAFGDTMTGLGLGIGTSVNDTFNGAGGNDTLRGLIGNDTLVGGAGNDLIEGGVGNDELTGSNGNDTVRGDAGNDSVLGGEGNDSLLGGDGNDTLDGSVGTDTLDGGLGDDFYIASAGDIVLDSGGFDTVETFVDFAINGNAAIEVLRARISEVSPDIDLTGSSAAQTLIGNNGNNVLAGLGGADTLDGGIGTDEASYAASNAAVNISMNRTSQIGAHAAGDQLISIERVRGSAFNDTLTGKSTFTAGDVTANTWWGLAGDDVISDAVGRNILYGGDGNDTLTGSGGVAGVAATGSVLYGGNGNDFLDAGVSTATGGDTLVGGAGNDTIRVTSAGDVVEEQILGGGTDTLIVAVTTWVMDGLQAAIENVTIENNFNLTANGLSNLITGSALANTIKGEGGNDTILGMGGGDNLIGGDGNDSLDGGTGGDRMEGGTGNDTYVVDSTGDTVVEAFLAGKDTVRASIDYTIAVGIESLVLTGLGAIDGTGNIFANTITGNAAANRLDGGGGADTLSGGGGNDIYVTDGGDTIIENFFGSSSGIDTVESSGTFTLSANVENLTLTGTASINGTGNALANLMIGNDGDNRLSGDLGSDTMQGGRGNDLYITEGADTIVETAGQGNDTVEASGTYTLTFGVEHLRLTGSAAINGTGNTLANTITGNSGANVLTGGSGADTFVFATALGTVDTITDMVAGLDEIHLDNAIFTALSVGALSVAAFKSNTTGLAGDITDRIIYETDTGRLYYDRDGTGVAARVHFASLSANLLITNADFLII